MSPSLFHGEVVCFFACDLAHEMRREPVARLLGQPVVAHAVDPSARNPRRLSFYRPQMVPLPPVERQGPHGPVQVRRTVTVVSLGALSITVRIPFAVADLAELAAYRDPQLDGRRLADEVRALAEEARRELLPLLVAPHDAQSELVAYSAIVLTRPPVPVAEGFQAEAWLQQHRRGVAGLLLQEADPAPLSEQQVQQATARWLSYYGHDLAVVGWDAALLVEPTAAVEQSLYIMELANLQLTELEAYDRILDQAVERSYRDVRRPSRVLLNRSLHHLRELRIDLARLSEELENTTKFFGDWYLARLYGELAGRLHLHAWHRAIDDKLSTIDDMYQLAKQDAQNRWMLVLEASILLLFIVEVVALFGGWG